MKKATLALDQGSMQISIFDLDHTLLKVNSSYRFGNYLYRQKWISFSALTTCLANYAFHKLLGLSIEKTHRNIFKALFQDRSLFEIEQKVSLFLDQELENLLYQPAIRRLMQAQKKGEHIVILSSSPDFLVSAIADRLSVTDWKATSYSSNRQGYLENISKTLEGEDKAEYMDALAHQFNTPLSSMTFYSDSLLDLPALQKAGKAVGVMPDRRLKGICYKNGWEIL